MNTWTVKPIVVAMLPVPGWECLFGENDCTMREIAFYVWILRSKNAVVLVDAGVPTGPEFDALNRANQALDTQSIFTRHQTLAELLEHEGILPESVTHLLLTQLITYCTGGLLRDYFPKAHVYAAWEGMQEFLTRRPSHPPREFYFTQESWAYLRDLLIENRLTFINETQGLIEILPGLYFQTTGGHHPGSAAIRVETIAGALGIIETAFIQENILQERPIGIAENAAQCREVIRQWKQSCALALAAHEPGASQILNQFLSLASSPAKLL